MRVLHIVQSLSGGGAETFVKELAVAQKQLGLDVAVLCAYGLSEPASIDGVDVYQTQGRRGVSRSRYLLSLVKIIKHVRPILVHTHTHVGSFWGRTAALVSRVPIIVHTEHMSLPRLRLHERIMTRILSRRTYSTVVFSERTARLVKSRDCLTRVDVIPNGVSVRPEITETQRALAKASLGYTGDNLVIGMICNLFPHKAPDIALDALRYLVSENTQELERRSLRLAIFGDGPMRSALERFVKVWGLEDWVRLFGFRVDLADILPGLDAILTTSLREMMPVSLLEAMNAGVAIIGAPHNGTLDLVADGVTGIVLKGWGPHHLAAALIDERVNKTWLRAAGSAGRARLMEHFDIRAVAKAYLALYRRACTNVLRCNYYG